MNREWNATSYHKVSGPQTDWGQRVLARLDLRGDERAIDAGCGSGRLTGALLERLPAGRLMAIDRSWNMLQTARANLRPAFGARVTFVQVALPALPFHEWADLVFSTATFHWVSDHAALFTGILAALRPGGRLHAQCGGGPNLAEAHALAESVMHEPPFREHFEGWPGAWQFATAEATRERLLAAGFVDVVTGLEAAPTTLASAADYREFVTTVIYHPHLSRLPEVLRPRFIDEVVARAAVQDPPFTLDYWRLNMQATRPLRSVPRTPPMKHPAVIRPAHHAVYAPTKMGKRTLFESPRLLAGLNAFEAGQEHALHAHPGQDKVYLVAEGSGVFLLDDRELPMTAGDLLIAPEGVPHGVRNPGPGRLLVVAVLAPAPAKG